MPVIKLQSSDGELFPVDVELIAKQSVVIGTMVKDLGGSQEDETVPLPNVTGNILRMVLDWCIHHKDDLPAGNNEGIVRHADGTITDGNEISGWDKEFLKEVDAGTLFHLVHAANYLDIQGLLDLTCSHAASMMTGKSAEELRETFNIENDFLPPQDDNQEVGNQ